MTSDLFSSDFQSILQRLQRIYPDQDAAQIKQHLVTQIEAMGFDPSPAQPARKWTEKDTLLITYGDSLKQPKRPPLQSLLEFVEQRMAGTFSGIHILPFFPYSSDDGFAVIDYYQVNHDLGDWPDIEAIGERYRLMADLVINHISRESLWFVDFLTNTPPGCDYFIELPPETDTSQVTRPRSSPLLVPIHTKRGLRHVWATFSEDQIDVNFANPDVLVEYVKILFHYIKHRSQIIRLDAVAFLWKRLGTACIHLPETHEVIKLLKDLIRIYSPDTLLITETNVPHEENISYFGDGDEADIVYQFSLAPLLLYTLNRGNATHFNEWAATLAPPPQGTTFLNFTASHDGIGLRPLEGLLQDREVKDLIESMHQYGGFVSMRSKPDGTDAPYEINISLFDALAGTWRGRDQWQVERFLCCQTVMLAMKGIPAVYIHSLLATPNDLDGVEQTERTRSINRKKWQLNELLPILDNPRLPQHRVFHELQKRIQTRRKLLCFHPEADQSVLELSHSVIAFLREMEGQKLIAVHNITAFEQDVSLSVHEGYNSNLDWYDWISETHVKDPTVPLKLKPYQCVWLTPEATSRG